MNGHSQERRYLEEIGPIVNRVLSRLGLSEAVKASQVFIIWEKVVGPAIARHAQPSAIRKGTLTVQVDSSTWLSQLDRYCKSEILSKLNSALPRPLVRQIVFKIGEIGDELK